VNAAESPWGVLRRHLTGPAEAAAVAECLAAGVLDAVAGSPDGLPADRAAGLLGGGRAGAGLVDADAALGLLAGAGLVTGSGRGWVATAALADLLAHRELLEASLPVIARAVADVAAHGDLLFRDLVGFSRRSATFAFFDYRTARRADPDAVAATRPWVRYLAALDTHEAPALLDLIDLTGAHHLLDVGGNAAGFALATCRRHPGLRATVVDLPAVAEITRDAVGAAGEPGRRVEVIPADLTTEPLTAVVPDRSVDAVVMKSFLHDWDRADAAGLLGAAVELLAPGGRLVVAERAGFTPATRPVPVADLPLMLFSSAVPGPDPYLRVLDGLGVEDVRVDTLVLDTRWFVLQAVAPG
jgi:SAM-dependent methyltransferase